MKAPFPYFGGKQAIAEQVWHLLGDPALYIEPFVGSAAMLLARPSPPRYEVIGDADHLVANFWRALRADPTGVADAAMRPMVEVDVVAIGRWLRIEAMLRLRTIESDPDAYDVEIAGRWAWVQCSALGLTNWSRMTSGYKGVNRRYADVPAELRVLAERLALVQVYLGDWERTVRAARWRGTCAVFLDPPYRREGRTESLYGVEATRDLHDRIESWCSTVPSGWRVVIAGYEGDFRLPEWRITEIPAIGRPAGQARARDVNQHRERLWTNVPNPGAATLFA